MSQLRKRRGMTAGSGANGGEIEAEEEAVTPAGRMFIQPRMSCHVLAIIHLEKPIDVPQFKQALLDSMVKHKRFSSILEKKSQKWVRTKVNIDDHLVLAALSEDEKSSPTCVEDYVADLALAPPMDSSRPLWQLHFVTDKSCVLRIHHSLGDGTSLMSLLIACTRKLDKEDELPSLEPRKKQKADVPIFSNLRIRLWSLLLMIWNTILEVGRFLLVSLFLKDSHSAIKGYAGVEHSAKKIAYLHMSIEDMKTVKRAVNGTINDVLLGMIAAGIARYLQHHQTPESTELKSLRIHASALVNTRKSPGLQELVDMMKGSSQARWGNDMGYILIPLPLKKCSSPLEYVRQAKKISDKKKLSAEPYFTYKAGSLLLKVAGPKAAADLTYKTLIHTTLAVSNIVGPLEQVAFCGNPIRDIIPTVVGHPQALCLHMQSYMGKATLVATAAKSIIPDPELLLQYCKDALHEMKEAATTATTKT